MDETDREATSMAVSSLRHTVGGSDPWTESEGTARCRGGFVWRDAGGNQFDVTISLFRAAPRSPAERKMASLRDAWQTVMLGDDSACTADPEAWRFAMSCREGELKKVGRP